MDHVGLFSAKLILTPLLLCIYLNKYDLGRARAKKKSFGVSCASENDGTTHDYVCLKNIC